MSSHFDPYYQWLGIRPDDQPPDFYRLLGLDRFEQNASAIQNAADRQMAHVRTFQAGEHAEQSQALLNQISAARVNLLDTRKKAAYDDSLRARIPAAKSPAPRAAAGAATPGVAPGAATARQRRPAGLSVAKRLDTHQPDDEADRLQHNPLEIPPGHANGRFRYAPVVLLCSAGVVVILVLGLVAAGVSKAPSAAIGKSAANKPEPPPPAKLPATTDEIRKASLAVSKVSVGPTPVDPAPQVPTGDSPTPDPQAADEENPFAELLAQPEPASDAHGPATSEPNVGIVAGGNFALRFNGPHRVELAGTEQQIDFNRPLTAEMWIRVNGGAGTSHWLGGTSQATAPRPQGGWYCNLRPQPRGSHVSWQIYYRRLVGRNNGAQGHATGIPVIEPGWHLVISSTPSPRPGTFRFRVFFDGRKYGEAERTISDINAGAGPFYLGANSADGRGVINADIRAFHLSLADRYQENFTPPEKFTSDRQTYCLLDFSKGSGDKLPDLSGNGHHGTIHGATWLPLEP